MPQMANFPRPRFSPTSLREILSHRSILMDLRTSREPGTVCCSWKKMHAFWFVLNLKNSCGTSPSPLWDNRSSNQGDQCLWDGKVCSVIHPRILVLQFLLVHWCIRIISIPPQDTLVLMLKFRVTAGGVTKVGNVTHKLHQKPLFACLLEQSSSWTS